MRRRLFVLIMCALLLFFVGCQHRQPPVPVDSIVHTPADTNIVDSTTAPPEETTAPPEETTAPSEETTAPPEETTAPPEDDAPISYMDVEAPGILAKRSTAAVIDYSNTALGYVMVRYTNPTNMRLKAQVKGPNAVTYTYNVTPEKWEAFPLSEGNGQYTVTLYANVSGTKYAAVLSVQFAALLQSEFAPFLYPNQYVDFSVAPNTRAKARTLVRGIDNPLEKVAVVYDYVVDTLTYDKGKAETVKSGYLPVLDSVLAEKMGICFDYAALMAGMLRSQGVPCKLVVGYAGKAYHAWINVWTEESGWIDGVIFFDGHKWQRMDPTFASSGNRSDSIMKYIGDGSNYTEKYLY